MTPERWQRVGALFDRALATPPPEREALVRSSGEPLDVQEEGPNPLDRGVDHKLDLDPHGS